MNPLNASLRGLSREELLKRIQSPKPTPYRLWGEGEGVYVYCALDALLYPLLAGKAWRVEARPPMGGPLRLTLTPKGPEEGRIWVSFIGPEAPLPEAPGMPSSRCPYLHFFATWEELWAWRATLPPEVRTLVQALPLSEAFRLAQRALEDLPEEDEAGGCC